MSYNFFCKILFLFFRYFDIFFRFWVKFLFFLFFCVKFGGLSGCGGCVIMILCHFWCFLCPFQRLLCFSGIFPCHWVRKRLKMGRFDVYLKLLGKK